MLQQVGTEEGGAIPRRRIFAHPVRLEEKPCAEVVLGLMRLVAEQVDQGRKTFGRQCSIRLEIKLAASKRVKTAQRDNHGRGTSRNHLDGCPRLYILR